MTNGVIMATDFLSCSTPASMLKTWKPAAQIPGKDERHGDEAIQMYPTLFLEPLKAYISIPPGRSKDGNIKNVYTFIVIAVFILLIACFNFVNLTTARRPSGRKR